MKFLREHWTDLIIIAIVAWALAVMMGCTTVDIVMVTGENGEVVCNNEEGETVSLVLNVECNDSPIEGLITEPEEDL